MPPNLGNFIAPLNLNFAKYALVYHSPSPLVTKLSGSSHNYEANINIILIP